MELHSQEGNLYSSDGGNVVSLIWYLFNRIWIFELGPVVVFYDCRSFSVAAILWSHWLRRRTRNWRREKRRRDSRGRGDQRSRFVCPVSLTQVHWGLRPAVVRAPAYFGFFNIIHFSHQGDKPRWSRVAQKVWQDSFVRVLLWWHSVSCYPLPSRLLLDHKSHACAHA